MTSDELSKACTFAVRSAVCVNGGDEKYAVAWPLLSASAAMAWRCDSMTI